MNAPAIERFFPTFAPPVRRSFLEIVATLHAVIGEARRTRSRFVVSFSSRVMKIVVLIVGSGMGWAVRRARIQREAVASVKRVGGSAWYDWQWKAGRPDPHKFQISPALELPRRHTMDTEVKQIRDHYNAPQTSGKSWRMPSLGADYFSQVVQISLGPHGTDTELVPIGLAAIRKPDRITPLVIPSGKCALGKVDGTRLCACFTQSNSYLPLAWAWRWCDISRRTQTTKSSEVF